MLLAAAAVVTALVGVLLSLAERRARRGVPVADVVVEEAGTDGPLVRGTARDGDGAPVVGAIVTVIGAGGAQLARTATDDDGAFAAPVDGARVSPAEHVVVLVSGAGLHPRAHHVVIGSVLAVEVTPSGGTPARVG